VRYVVVCVHKDCPMKGSLQIKAALEERLEEEGLLYEEVEVAEIDCFSLCQYAPNVAVMPDRVVFSHLKVEDVPRIVEFLKGGERPKDLEEGPPSSAKRVALERCALLLDLEEA